MFLNIDGIFDNVRLSDLGLAIVTTEGGMLESFFGVNQTPIEEKFKGIEEPFVYGVERNSFTFPITLAIIDYSIKWDYEKRVEVANLLFQSDYKWLVPDDNDGMIGYQIMFINESKRYDNGINQGYITLTAKTKTCYAYSYPKQYAQYDLESTLNIIEMINMSNVKDYKYYPILEFTLTGLATSISFKNLSDGGRIFSFTNLNVDETVYVDCKKGEVISSTGLTRLGNTNRLWLKLVYGINQIEVTTNFGGCIVKTEMMFPMIL